MKNKTQTLLTVAITLLTPLFSFSQNGQTPADILKMHHETLGDSYLPNAYNNKKTSAPYSSTHSSIRNTSIFTIQVNVDSNGQNILFDAANEPNMALNPLDKNEMVIGWRQFDNVSSNFRQAGWSYTSDAGQTWTFPGKIEAGIFRSDPVLDYDVDGNFYYNSLTITPDYFCKVFESTDGGSSWDSGTDAHGGDKQCMVIDRTTGVGSGNIYSSWTSYYSTCSPGFFTRSTDGNNSYEDCTSIDDDPFWGTMAIGKDGELYVGAGNSQSTDMVVAKSLDAQVPGSSISWDATLIDMDGYLSFGGTVNPGGLLGQVNIDVDRSEGMGGGNVYMLASLTRLSNSDPGDVMFVKSTDGGATWSSPIKINDDVSVGNYQWLGAMSVSPTGRIDAVWLDTRDAPGTDSSALYYSYSIDEGNTWSANEKMSDLFDPHVGYPNQNKMGDYFDMISDTTGAHLAWANTLNGEEDVYYSHIVPQIATGVTAISDDASFSVFPNPTSGSFVITSPENQSQLEIYNTLGKKVYSTIILKTKNEIDISSQPVGVYFLRIVNQNGSITEKKIIREQG